MADLVPVEHDPFRDPPSGLVPVDHDPFSVGPVARPGESIRLQNVPGDAVNSPVLSKIIQFNAIPAIAGAGAAAPGSKSRGLVPVDHDPFAQ